MSRYEDITAMVAELFDPYMQTVTGTPERRRRLIEKSRQLVKRIERSRTSPAALDGYKHLVAEMKDICSAQILEVSMQIPDVPISPPKGVPVS